ncbi:plasmid recombination protein, partial [Gluconobacter sp. P1D12_c]|uniref:plasmid recombination protein n=1 Tax=Gluconobacter sp. P1D12_c TaxID=2762614 RepID=UPI001C054F51
IIHRDEKPPHLSAYVVPNDPDTGRLNCRRCLGGAKALNEMQTDFARVVGRPVVLERGIEGSQATHTKPS